MALGLPLRGLGRVRLESLMNLRALALGKLERRATVASSKRTPKTATCFNRLTAYTIAAIVR